MYELIRGINSPADIKRMNKEDLSNLAKDIRKFLIKKISATGGHLASNLGVVELTLALHKVFDSPEDKIIWDVGHQAYVHKILTGRQDGFDSLRQYGGMSGFPKESESQHDIFDTGHSSTSISVALGLACARDIQKQKHQVIAVIGDGAFTGGMAIEALNNLGYLNKNMIVILNDNEMSIGKNVGGMSRHLSRLRSSENYLEAKRAYRQFMKKIPGGKVVYDWSSRVKNRIKRFLLPSTIFENMGFTYLGPADGHDLPGLISLLTAAKDLREPVLVHVVTKKGYGYPFAEEDPAKFHGIGKFNPDTGKKLGPKTRTFSDSFGDAVVDLAHNDRRVCAITAAMPGGTGLLKLMRQNGERLFDVGIAEEHAISMAGGLAKQGMIPIVALYSTFLQRGYDQIMQDICMLRLHVILAVDRAGLVGDDGPTHHGVFDVGFLRQMPGMLLLNPVSFAEQQDMLRWAVSEYDGPVAIRYPRGSEGSYTASDWKGLETGIITHRQGKDVTFVTYGVILDNVLEAAKLLSRQGIEATVLRLVNLTDLHEEQILELAPKDRPVIVVEEAATGSGIHEALAYGLMQLCPGCRVSGRDLGKDFITHGNVKKLYEICGLDATSLAAYAKEVVEA